MDLASLDLLNRENPPILASLLFLLVFLRVLLLPVYISALLLLCLSLAKAGAVSSFTYYKCQNFSVYMEYLSACLTPDHEVAGSILGTSTILNVD